MTGEADAAEVKRKGAVRRKVTFTGVAAGIALFSSAVALVFTLWPGLRPDPRTNHEAEVSVFAVERAVTYGDYLERTSPTGGPTRQGAKGIDHDLPGQVVYVSARVLGFKRSSVMLRWSAYDARTEMRLPSEALGGVPDVERTLETPTDRFVQPVYVYPLFGPTKYFVRVELVDSDGLMLAVADSEPFRGLSAGPSSRGS